MHKLTCAHTQVAPRPYTHQLTLGPRHSSAHSHALTHTRQRHTHISSAHARPHATHARTHARPPAHTARTLAQRACCVCVCVCVCERGGESSPPEDIYFVVFPRRPAKHLVKRTNKVGRNTETGEQALQFLSSCPTLCCDAVGLSGPVLRCCWSVPMHRQTDTHINRQHINRQTGKQTDGRRPTDRHKDTHTNRQTNRQTDGWTDRQTRRQT